MWHPTIRDVIIAHEAVRDNSQVRTEGFRQSPETGLENIRKVLEEAREVSDTYLSAAIYLQKLIEKHPFKDGNKRTAILVTSRFLEENNESFEPHKVQETSEIYEIIKWELHSMTVEETAYWLKTGGTE